MVGSKFAAEPGVADGEDEEAGHEGEVEGVVHSTPSSHGSSSRGVKGPAEGVKKVSRCRLQTKHRNLVDSNRHFTGTPP